MNLFVDSNIFLDFYHFSSDDLDELKKLTKLISDGEIILIVTRQVRDEVLRNRDNKVSDAYKKFKDSKVELMLPQICKSYPEYELIRNALSNLRKAKSELHDKLITDIEKRSLKADEIISELFGLSNVVESEKYIEKAQLRMQLGNPPGKKQSYGDAVSWETLLSEVKNQEDLFFISDDKDYKSPLDDSKFDSFLLQEWKEKKGSALFFYNQLSGFFRKHRTEIDLRSEVEKNTLINQLSQSGSFSTTHKVIGKLSEFSSFTDSQIKQIVGAAVTNSQIFTISSDNDVNFFLNSVMNGKDAILDVFICKEFRKIYSQRNLDAEAKEISSDDFPFSDIY